MSTSPIQRDANGKSPFELQREERIRRNEAVLKSLGLGKADLEALKKIKPTSRQLKKNKIKVREENLVLRRSSRFNNDGNDDELLSLDDSQTFVAYTYVTEEEKQERRERKRQNGPSSLALSEKESAALKQQQNKTSTKAFDSENFIVKFSQFAWSLKGMSKDNHKKIIVKANLLIRGEGIHYHHWKEGVFFEKGIPVTPLTNYADLYQRAKEMCIDHGRDLGNGWLLAHPIKKLSLFQHFTLNNPDFLDSGMSFNEFCEDVDDDDDDEEEEEGVDDDDHEEGVDVGFIDVTTSSSGSSSSSNKPLVELSSKSKKKASQKDESPKSPLKRKITPPPSADNSSSSSSAQQAPPLAGEDLAAKLRRRSKEKKVAATAAMSSQAQSPNLATKLRRLSKEKNQRESSVAA